MATPMVSVLGSRRVGSGRLPTGARVRLFTPPVARAIVPPDPEMTLRRLLFLAAAVALVANRRRVVTTLVRLTGTNVHSERASRPGT
jgi:hypothetical protein